MTKQPRILTLLLLAFSIGGTAHAGTGANGKGKAAQGTKVKVAAKAKRAPARKKATVTAGLGTTRKSAARRTRPVPTKAEISATQTSVEVDDGPLGALMSQLAMLQLGNAGNTQAHMFLEDTARYGGGSRATPESRLWSIRGQFRKFKGPKNDGSIIVMFGDRSGAYIHPDGFVTPMGSDIAHEVSQWEEMKD